MHFNRMILCTFLLLFTSAHSFVAHRSTTDLNIDRPAESMATAIKNVELQLSLPESVLVSMKKYSDQNVRRKRRHDIASTEDIETLNSATAITTKRSNNDHHHDVYEKPALREQLKTFMQNVNSDAVVVLRKMDDQQTKIENINDEQTKRSGKQLNLIASDDSGSMNVNIDGTTFHLLPFNLKNIMKFPSMFKSQESGPTRVWAIGSVAKFPPVLEHFLQRIQSYYSIYKYDDLSRPGFLNSGSGNQVVRITTTTAPTTAAEPLPTLREEEKTSIKTPLAEESKTESNDSTISNEGTKTN